jgi:hypothetical protein
MKKNNARKLVYLKEKIDNGIASEKEISEYNNMLQYHELLEADINETINNYGYSKNSAIVLQFQNDNSFPRNVLLYIIVIIIIVFYGRDHHLKENENGKI